MSKDVFLVGKDPLSVAMRDKWMIDVATAVAAALIDKHSRGRIEHGTDLGEVSSMKLLDELYGEQQDSIIYLSEIRRRIAVRHDVIISRDLLAKVMGIVDREIIVGKLSPIEQASITQLKNESA